MLTGLKHNHISSIFSWYEVSQSGLLVGSSVPDFPHLLIIQRMNSVRQHWLYPPFFSSSLKHLFHNDDICHPCIKKKNVFWPENVRVTQWAGYYVSVFMQLSVIPHQLSGLLSFCVYLILKSKDLLFFSHVAPLWIPKQWTKHQLSRPITHETSL